MVNTTNAFAPLSDQHKKQSNSTIKRVYSRTIRRSALSQVSSSQAHKSAKILQSRDKTPVQQAGAVGNRGRQDGIVYGTATSSHLRAAQVSRQGSNNRICSGVFVTQLDPKTTPRSLASTVKLRTGYAVRPEKLPTKYSTYSSFYIRCDKKMRGILLDANIWPKNSWAKPFYN